MGMTKTQAATIATLSQMLTAGPVDVTFGGIKGVNRSSLWTLEEKGLVTIERRTVAGRNYPDMFVTAIS